MSHDAEFNRIKINGRKKWLSKKKLTADLAFLSGNLAQLVTDDPIESMKGITCRIWTYPVAQAILI
jgi:hypothetical protein